MLSSPNINLLLKVYLVIHFYHILCLVSHITHYVSLQCVGSNCSESLVNTGVRSAVWCSSCDVVSIRAHLLSTVLNLQNKFLIVWLHISSYHGLCLSMYQCPLSHAVVCLLQNCTVQVKNMT